VSINDDIARARVCVICLSVSSSFLFSSLMFIIISEIVSN